MIQPLRMSEQWYFKKGRETAKTFNTISSLQLRCFYKLYSIRIISPLIILNNYSHYCALIYPLFLKKLQNFKRSHRMLCNSPFPTLETFAQRTVQVPFLPTWIHSARIYFAKAKHFTVLHFNERTKFFGVLSPSIARTKLLPTPKCSFAFSHLPWSAINRLMQLQLAFRALFPVCFQASFSEKLSTNQDVSFCQFQNTQNTMTR